MRAKDAIWGELATRIEAALGEVDADLADLIVRVAYDEVFERPGLDLKTRELLAIAHLMSVGGADELSTHIHGALNCGASGREIRESILHGAMFVGFPRALAAMQVAARVLEKADPPDAG